MATVLPVSWAQLCSQFEASCFPVWLVDTQMRVLWVNGCTRALYPAHCLADGIRIFMTTESCETAQEQVAKGVAFTVVSSVLGMPHAQMAFTPYCTTEGTQGAYVLHCPQTTEQPELHQSVENAGNLAITQGMRRNMNDIFYALSACNSKLRSAGCEKLVEEQLRQINHSCYRVMRTAISLSEKIKLSAGVAPTLATINLWDCCAELFSAVETLLISAKLNFTYTLPQSDVYVECDFERLSAALLSILSNSYLHGGEGVEVSITGKDAGGQVQLTIVDNGKGIPPALLADAFQPFAAAELFCREDAGLGLGLHLARGLVGSIGGSLRIRSEEGSTVVAIALPTVPPPQTPPSLSSTSSDYMRNRYSRPYFELCDVVPPPYII